MEETLKVGQKIGFVQQRFGYIEGTITEVFSNPTQGVVGYEVEVPKLGTFTTGVFVTPIE